MKIITEKFKNNWRKLVSAVFILLAFLMPATRNFLAEIFDVTTYAANNKHNNNHNNSNSSKSESRPSVSCPDSHDTVSPMQNSHDNSTNSHSHSKKKKNKPNPK